VIRAPTVLEIMPAAPPVAEPLLAPSQRVIEARPARLPSNDGCQLRELAREHHPAPLAVPPATRYRAPATADGRAEITPFGASSSSIDTARNSEDQLMAGPLAGYRVLDFSQMMQGPWAAQMLGDMGADVIKIEPPVRGERGRRSGIAFIEGESLFFHAMNRNKRGLTLNLKDPRGQEIAWTLIKGADVLIENFRPGVMERLGFGYDAVRQAAPRLVYCSATGYGPSGPLAHKPGQDLLIQALSGIMSITGRESEPPGPAGIFIADVHAATMLAFGVACALLHRGQSGQGQRVEINLLSAAIDLQAQELVTYLNAGIEPRRAAMSGHAYMEGPYGVYRASDGYLALSMIPVEALAEALAMPELTAAFPDKAALYARRDELVGAIQPVLERHTVAHWMAEFDRRDLWAAPVLGYDEVATHPQVRANRMAVRVASPIKEDLALTGLPLTLSETGGAIRLPPPLVGQHTDDILAELGYDRSRIAELRQAGVV
jgi:crotonobetainyl-CoA:carnitine CoA-transferase CaiB-like acyl-CoA transferase